MCVGVCFEGMGMCVLLERGEGNKCWGQCLSGQVFFFLLIFFFDFRLQGREQRGNSNQNNPRALA